MFFKFKSLNVLLWRTPIYKITDNTTCYLVCKPHNRGTLPLVLHKKQGWQCCCQTWVVWADLIPQQNKHIEQYSVFSYLSISSRTTNTFKRKNHGEHFYKAKTTQHTHGTFLSRREQSLPFVNVCHLLDFLLDYLDAWISFFIPGAQHYLHSMDKDIWHTNNIQATLPLEKHVWVVEPLHFSLMWPCKPVRAVTQPAWLVLRCGSSLDLTIFFLRRMHSSQQK